MSDSNLSRFARPTIAVVGGGNGSYTAAADLTLAGYDVRFLPGSAERLSLIHI